MRLSHGRSDQRILRPISDTHSTANVPCDITVMGEVFRTSFPHRSGFWWPSLPSGTRRFLCSTRFNTSLLHRWPASQLDPTAIYTLPFASESLTGGNQDSVGGFLV